MSFGDDAPRVPRPGQTLLGKFAIEAVVGRGAMGVVLSAMHLQLEERVAIKVLLPEFAQDEHVVARFLQEGRSAVKIKSDHVGRVLDVGTVPNGPPFIVMEFLEGEDLSKAIRRDGMFDPGRASDILLQACDAIAYAHSIGIVHRDIKPANLFLARSPGGAPVVKVLDFGISKLFGTDANDRGELTSTQAILGSPNYMAPEQLRAAKDVDLRADIWSLGVVFHQMLTGRIPFKADSLIQLYEAIQSTPAVYVTPLRGDIPKGVDAIVTRCLRPDRNDRFPNVAELAAALGPFAAPETRMRLVPRIAEITALGEHSRHSTEGAPPSARPDGYRGPAGSSGTLSADGTRGSWNQRVAPPPSKRPWIPVAAAASVALAIGLGAAFVKRSPPASAGLAPTEDARDSDGGASAPTATEAAPPTAATAAAIAPYTATAPGEIDDAAPPLRPSGSMQKVERARSGVKKGAEETPPAASTAEFDPFLDRRK